MAFSTGGRSQRHALERTFPAIANGPLDVRPAHLFEDAYALPPGKRDRLWELSPNLHCSIIGTCLTTADLRGLAAKLGLPRATTEHDLHSHAVSRAGRKEEGGKLLHKLLDRRHDREIRTFERADTAQEVRALWQTASAKGEIPGAYWAVLTHPRTDRDLVKDVFGEVHMLSHLLGRSVRADLRRLADLDAQVAAQDEIIAAQAARIAALTDDRIALRRRVAAEADSAAATTRASARREAPEIARNLEGEVARLTEQAGRLEEHARAERVRREEAERALHSLAKDIKAGAVREADLRDEVAALERLAAEGLPDADATDSPSLSGVTLLYVGGRPQTVAQVRRIVGGCGGRLLAHDGGLEDNPSLLPGLVAQADAVLFPVDCVSHDAVGTLKRHCRDRGIPFLPLRSAGTGAFAAAVSSFSRKRTTSIGDRAAACDIDDV